MIRILLMTVVAAFLATACTMEHEINFEKNMSGDSSFSINYSEMMNTMASFSDGIGDTEGQESMSEKEVKELKKEMESIEGISNVDFTMSNEENNVVFVYDFADINALNTALSGPEEGETKSEIEVVYLEGDKLVYNFWGKELSDMFDTEVTDEEVEEIQEEIEESSGLEIEDEAVKGVMDMMSMALSSMKYKATLRFSKPVKSVSNDLYTISKSKKEVLLDVDMGDLIEAKRDLKVEIGF